MNTPCLAAEKSYYKFIKELESVTEEKTQTHKKKCRIATSAISDGGVDVCSTAKKNPINFGLLPSALRIIADFRRMET